MANRFGSGPRDGGRYFGKGNPPRTGASRRNVPPAVRDDEGKRGYSAKPGMPGDFERRDAKPAPRYGGDRPAYKGRDERPSFGKPTYKGRDERPSFDKPAYKGRDERPSFGKPAYKGHDERPSFDKPAYKGHDERPSFDKPAYKSRDERPAFGKPAYKGHDERPSFDKPAYKGRDERPAFQKPAYEGEKPAFKPRGERPSFGKPAFRAPRFDERPAPDRFDTLPVREGAPRTLPQRGPVGAFRPLNARPPMPAPAPAPLPPEENEDARENIIAGRNPIREALKAGHDMEKLLIARGEISGSAREIVAKARERGVVVQEVDRARLDAIYPGHQGMIAFVSAAQYAQLDDVFALAAERGEDPFIVVLDGITDPHNLGAILRTCECCGAHGVLLPQRRSVGLTPAAVKVAAGAQEYVKVVRVVNLTRTLEELKERGLWIYAADMDGENAFSAPLGGPVALVIGSEGEGVSPLVLKQCDRKLSLPMKGHIGSLNASVAAGVLLYAVQNARSAK